MKESDLSDEELSEYVLEQLEADSRLNSEYIKIECLDGVPVLSGRVANDEQLEIVEELLSDIHEINSYENNIWVDDTLSFEISRKEAMDPETVLGDDNLSTEDTFDDEET